MKNFQFVLLLCSLVSCSFSHEVDDNLSEFAYPPSSPIHTPNSFGLAYIETDTLNVGDTFRAKIFMANRHNVYDSDSIEPIIKFQFEEDYKGIENLIYEVEPVKVINDTAYVKSVLKDERLKVGESKIKKWYASVTIPLHPRDTTFMLEYYFVLQNK
jgi:hypothetical protein